MFRQCCVNDVSMLAPNVVLGCVRSRMAVTFKFEFSTHLQHQQASLHWNNHIYKHSWVILLTTAVELKDRWWILNTFLQYIHRALFEYTLSMSETHSSTVFKCMFFIFQIIKSCFLQWSFWPQNYIIILNQFKINWFDHTIFYSQNGKLNCWPLVCSSNIAAMLWQCWKWCNFLMLVQCCANIGTLISPNHSYIVAWMLKYIWISTLGAKVCTVFIQRCLKFVTWHCFQHRYCNHDKIT